MCMYIHIYIYTCKQGISWWFHVNHPSSDHAGWWWVRGLHLVGALVAIFWLVPWINWVSMIIPIDSYFSGRGGPGPPTRHTIRSIFWDHNPWLPWLGVTPSQAASKRLVHRPSSWRCFFSPMCKAQGRGTALAGEVEFLECGDMSGTKRAKLVYDYKN